MLDDCARKLQDSRDHVRVIERAYSDTGETLPPKEKWLFGAGGGIRIDGKGYIGEFEAIPPSRKWSVFAALTRAEDDVSVNRTRKYLKKYPGSSKVEFTETRAYIGAKVLF
jgi:hypothetical protein